MGRRAIFPPKIHTKGKFDRVYWQGRWHHLGPKGSEESARTFKRLIGEWARDAPEPVTAADLTVNVLCVAYLTQQHKERAGKRELENIRAAVNVLTRTWGKLPAKQFDTSHLLELQKVMADGSWLTEEEKARRKKNSQNIGWCKNRVNLNTNRIRAVFRWAETKRLVPKGTWHSLLTVAKLSPESQLARDTDPRQPSEWAEVFQVALRCPAAVGAMLLLQWWSGMRSEEVRIMRTMDVSTILDVWEYRPGSDLPFGKHKNAHRRQKRVVLLGGECQKILRYWLKFDRPTEYLFVPQGNRAERDHYTRHQYARAVSRAAEPLGIDLCPYMGRHAAKRRITREMGLDYAAAFLGQKSIRTTEGYGGGIDLDAAAEAARKLA